MKFYQEWEACILDSKEQHEYFKASVPGNIQKDYAEHIGIGDLFFSNTLTALEKTEGYTWEYRTVLDFAPEAQKKVFFVAEGIDYIFDILLDGNLILSQEGMYTPVALDITNAAKVGSVLQVIIHPHPKYEAGEVRSRQEAAQSAKPPVGYGWDWNPRLLVSGLWLPAYIELRGDEHIQSCEPEYKLSLEDNRAEVTFNIECATSPEITVYDPDGNTVYQGTDTSFTLDNVRLWWCNGQGEPALYSWKAQTADDIKQGKLGFKTVRLLKNEGTMGEPADFPKECYSAPMTIELNGRRIFAKGSNFVNADIFPAITEKSAYKKLVSAAKDANMNMFRIWGGAGLAKPDFYELCDEMGIMVWQEFMLACNNYEGTEHYLDVLQREATSIIKQLRSHACITLWCGGNELFNGWSGMDMQSLAIRLLNKLCYELDRTRPFLMTSPLNGVGHGGYLFLYSGNKEVFEVLPQSHKVAYCEFGMPSLAPIDQIKQIIPKDELFPMTPTDAWIYHHAFEAWEKESWACLDILEKYFGKASSLEELISNSQWMQSAGYQCIFEESRRQWPYCSMALNWCFNEPWITAANNSLLSYPDIKKPAYYTVANSLQNVLITARIPKFSWQDGETLSFELWYLNDSTDAVSDTVTAFLEIGDESYELLEWRTGDVDALSNKQGPTVNFKLPAVSEAKEMKIILKTAADKNNSYRLVYKCNDRTDEKLRRMNT